MAYFFKKAEILLIVITKLNLSKSFDFRGNGGVSNSNILISRQLLLKDINLQRYNNLDAKLSSFSFFLLSLFFFFSFKLPWWIFYNLKTRVRVLHILFPGEENNPESLIGIMLFWSRIKRIDTMCLRQFWIVFPD